jgi:hypothetical protein
MSKIAKRQKLHLESYPTKQYPKGTVESLYFIKKSGCMEAETTMYVFDEGKRANGYISFLYDATPFVAFGLEVGKETTVRIEIGE